MSNINTPNDKNEDSLAEEMEISLEKDINEEIVEVVNDVDQESKIIDQNDRRERKVLNSNNEDKKSENHEEDDFSVEVAVNEEELVNRN